MERAKLIHTDIILIDIIGYSKLNNKQQFETVNIMTLFFKKAINLIVSKSSITKEEALLGFIATGDGFFMILSPKLKGFGVIFGLSLKNLSKNIQKKIPYFEGIKVAVHTGYVMPFKDILGHQNFLGDGLNHCARYLEYKNPDIYKYKIFKTGYVIVSKASYEEFGKFLSENRRLKEFLYTYFGFQSSNWIKFQDKHKNVHYGLYVLTEKEVVITPP